VNTALVAAMIALASVGQLGIGGALVSYLPRVRHARNRLIWHCYAASTVTSVVLAAAFVAVAPRFVHDLGALRVGWIRATFLAAVAVWAAFGLQDNILTSLRRAMWVPLENIAYSAAKLAVVVVIAQSFHGIGVFVSWVAPAALALIPINMLIFRRLLPASPAVATLDADAMRFRRFVTAETGGVFLWQISTTILPVLVVARVGATAGALFAIPWLLAQAVDLVAGNLGMSLTVEAAGDHRATQRILRHVLRRAIPLVTAIAITGVVGASLLLRVYGHTYGSSSATVLRVLLVACVPRAVIVLAIGAARAELAVVRMLTLQATLAVTVVPGAWLLMGRYGIEGAAIAWLAGQVVALVVVIGGSRRRARTSS
jgi:O-antigen/teichoic acid export membrane protein